LKDTYNLAIAYRKLLGRIDEAKAILQNSSEGDMIELAKDQLNDAQDALPELEKKLKIALLPKDLHDEKNVFVEIRPAA
jgi:peptide chain release factor 1